MSWRNGSAAVFMWKMWATHARMNPCAASHSLSLRIESAAAWFTSGSGLGSAVAMPPMGTAPRLRHTATRRRKMLAMNGVVFTSTPNRSGHTDFGIGHDVLEDGGLEVPAGGVEAGRVGAELVEHLLHLVHARQ